MNEEDKDFITERTNMIEGYLSVHPDCKTPLKWIKEVNERFMEIEFPKEQKEVREDD